MEIIGLIGKLTLNTQRKIIQSQKSAKQNDTNEKKNTKNNWLLVTKLYWLVCKQSGLFELFVRILGVTNPCWA